MIVSIVILCAVGACATLWFISVNNSINKYKIKIDEARSDLDVALVKRFDILSNSLNVVKGYAKHEKEAFIELVRARKGMSLDEERTVAGNQKVVESQIMAVREEYPELSSNKLFMELQRQLDEQNEFYAAAKRLLNSNISYYNQYISQFPASVVAGIKNCKSEMFLEEEEREIKKEIRIEF